MCKHNTMPYKKEDKYMLALAKLYEKETEKKKEGKQKMKATDYINGIQNKEELLGDIFM